MLRIVKKIDEKNSHLIGGCEVICEVIIEL